MAACLLMGRQRTASRTVEASSSLMPSIDAMNDWPLWQSSSSKIVPVTLHNNWSDTWWAASETAVVRSLAIRVPVQSAPGCWWVRTPKLQ